MRTLTIIRGLPGSGKTTKAKILAKTGEFLHFEADMYFVNRDGEYIFDGSKIKDAHNWCFNAVRESLRWGIPTIVSNTFTQTWEMEKYLELLDDFDDLYITVTEAHTKWAQDPTVCVDKNTHGVPFEVIERMADRWEEFSSNHPRVIVPSLTLSPELENALRDLSEEQGYE